MPFPSDSPTRSEPTRPGPAVAATAETSASVAPASASAASRSGRQVLEVRARGDLGHDAAEGAVRVLLRGDDATRARALPRRGGRRPSRRRTSRTRGGAGGRSRRTRSSEREEPREARRVRALGNPALRHDRVDEGGRRHVEGRVERGDARRARSTPCRRPAAAGRRPPRRRAPRSGSPRRPASPRPASSSAPRPRTARRGRAPRARGRTSRPCSRRRRSPRCGPRPTMTACDAPARDEGRRRHVREERDGQAVLRELPRREARALEERARLVREDRDLSARGERAHDPEGGADSRRGERSRVAVREDGRDPGGKARPQPGGPEPPDLGARGAVLRRDEVRLGLEEPDAPLRRRPPPSRAPRRASARRPRRGSRRSGARPRAGPRRR